MRYFLIGVGIFFALIIIGAISMFGAIRGSYNRLVGERATAKTQEAQVETEEQRRLDLLPNTAIAAKAGLVHEETVFANIAKAQAAFTNAQDPVARNDAGNQLGTALRGYLVVAQQYPQLRGLNSIETLTTEIEGTENRINVARRDYNTDVQMYDQDLQGFITQFLANYYHFQPLPLFQEQTAAKSAPNLQQNLK